MIWDREKVDCLELQLGPASLRLHIHGYGYEYDDVGGDWCKVSMELKAEDWLYFKADEEEMIASMDIDELIYQLEQLTQEKMNEEWVSCFCEPAISIKLYQIFSERENEMFLYMNWSIYDWITFTLYKEDISLVLEYLRKVKAGKTEPGRHEETVDANNEQDWRFCVVGNIVRTHPDEEGITRYGTKAFAGGAKVYLDARTWLRREYSKEEITVIGKNRFGRYEIQAVPLAYIENIRTSRVFKPTVLKILDHVEWMDGWHWWGRTSDDRREAKEFVKMMAERKND